MMKIRLIPLHWLALSLLLAAGSPLFAQVVRMGGGLKPGFARPPLHLNLNPKDAASNYGPYSPVQIRHAYGVDLLTVTGTGQKIGIVDAYGDPSIQTDLDNFCSLYGIASTTVQIIYPQGQPSGRNSSWALETALDVEWTHAIAPGATIILSVAKSASLTDLLGAVTAAVNAGAAVISMSWGTSEFAGANAYDTYFQAPGVTYVASSGDSGELASAYEVEWPASSPYVISVGGTTLYLDASGNRITPTGVPASETAWSGSGGGVSGVYSAPDFQSGWLSDSSWLPAGFNSRTVPDVSFVADPNTGVAVVYGAYLYAVGGTSAGAPQWAALIALANQGRSAGVGGNTAIYSVAGNAPSLNSSRLFDIVSGSNDTTPDADDLADAGYDLVTGLGSPLAGELVPALCATPLPQDFSISASPASLTVKRGRGGDYTVTVTALNDFSGSPTLSVAGLPSGASASFGPPSITISGASTMTVSASNRARRGTYALTISGASGLLNRSTKVTLTVN